MAGSKKKLKKYVVPPSVTKNMGNDDDELMDDLLSQLDSRDQTVQAESAAVLEEITVEKISRKQDPKNRFKARQARKAAAAEANYSKPDPQAEARLEQEAKDEEMAIKQLCDDLNVHLHEINPDGHCLFSAVADQLTILSVLDSSQASYQNVRAAASQYIYTHPDDFLPFLPSSRGEDGTGATDSGIMSPDEFEWYCKSIRDTAVWGGEPEILALSRAYNIPIHVIQHGHPPIVVHNPSGSPNDGDIQDKRAVRISYHRRMYGLGEHYNSLRPNSGMAKISDAIHHVLS